ncbi:MAG: class I SAM-dependent methyltransferase [Chlorobium sp.]|nr:class I SAM-dependent methyltransferase [Chlorobium sp.]
MLKRAWKTLYKLFMPKKPSSLLEYWRDRANRYGKLSVLNIAHRDQEFDAVTDYQKQLLFPLLKIKLNGSETNTLDFGCGPGRFTSGLAELIGGSVIGVDITPELLKLAPEFPFVSYKCIETGVLPFCDSSFDVVWSCLVLGGIPNKHIEQSIAEIERVLRPGGLFFYVENTAKAANTEYWFFRDKDTYIHLAAFCKPQMLGHYVDMGQEITIFAGNKPCANAGCN